ncbi:MAG: efflux RND transporter permease subunit, partial [Megasphaera micronuciformis]|nr:efflux RND transporter permease subunit [Megasphaera micronuciformis]
MISKFFINRPIFAIVISLVISIAGILSIITLPVSKYPK